jgi:hypothetical protein
MKNKIQSVDMYKPGCGHQTHYLRALPMPRIYGDDATEAVDMLLYFWNTDISTRPM